MSASFYRPAFASDDYGGGWSYITLDMSSSVTRDILNQNIVRRRAGIPTSRPQGRSVGGATQAVTPFGALGLEAPDASPAPVVQTGFARSKVLQQKSQMGILAEVKRRQPGAEQEYARVFAGQDMARLFDKAVQGYGLRNNDVADTMAAYWLVSWVIANDAKDFSPVAAHAVRDQLKGGIARTGVPAFSSEKKHRLADEAIFNTLIATQVFEYAQSGKISKADYRRIADIVQETFLTFGADLRALQLTDAGFVKR